MHSTHSQVTVVAADSAVLFSLEEVLRENRCEVTTERSQEIVAALRGRRHVDRAHPRVLLVAADPMVRFTLEAMLREYPYEVTTERSEGRVAALVGRRSFDALVLVCPLLQATNSELVPAEPRDDQEMWLECIPL